MDNNLIPFGIPNIGNTCYTNAILQCIRFIEPFREYMKHLANNDDKIIIRLLNLLNLNHVIPKQDFKEQMTEIINNFEENDYYYESKLNIMEELKLDETQLYFYLNLIKNNNTKLYFYAALTQLLEDMESNNFNQENFHKFIQLSVNAFRSNDLEYLFNGEQNDASEYFSYLLYFIIDSHLKPFAEKDIKQELEDYSDHKCYLSNKDTLNKSELLKLRIFNQIEKFNYDFKKTNQYTLLHDIMFSNNLQYITCGNCGYIHINIFKELNYSLNIPKKQNVSIYNCFEKYFSSNILEDFTCDNCKEKSHKTYKKRKMLDCPKILSLSLVRTEFTQSLFGMTTHKNISNVKYFKNIDMSNYIINQNIINNSNTKYKLISVVNHIGSGFGGHYYTYSLDTKLNQWYVLNDESVRKINIDRVLSNDEATMLIYERIDE
jgi:ubiquitin C-terminal hydrolase